MPFGKLRNPITEEVLYDGLWRIFVIDIHANKREKVLKLLDAMVDAMYKRQELFVHKQEFESKFNDELNYLFQMVYCYALLMDVYSSFIRPCSTMSMLEDLWKIIMTC